MKTPSFPLKMKVENEGLKLLLFIQIVCRTLHKPNNNNKRLLQQIIIMRNSLLLCILLLTVKTNNAQNVLWAKKINSTASMSAVGAVIDYNHDIISTGLYSDAGSVGGITLATHPSINFFIAKHDASGNLLWAKGIGGNNWDEVFSITKDKNNNIFVTGRFNSDTLYLGGNNYLLSQYNGYNMFVLKYDAAGTLQWAKGAYSVFSGFSNTQGNDVVTDQSNNIYVAGFFDGNGYFDNLTSTFGIQNMFIAKYNSNGNLLWMRKGEVTNGSNGSYNDGIQGIAVDTNYNIYATGKLTDSISFNGTKYGGNTVDGNFMTFKMDSAGNIQWLRTIGNGASNLNADIGKDIAVTPSGDVVVGGTTNDSSAFVMNGSTNTFYDKYSIALIKYSSNGNTIWDKRQSYLAVGYNSPLSFENSINEVKINNQGEIYVTGRFMDSVNLFGTMMNGSIQDGFMAKLDNAGNHLWSVQCGGPYDDNSQALDIDPINNNVAIAGFFQDTLHFNGGTTLISSGYEGFLAYIGTSIPSTTFETEVTKDIMIYPNPSQDVVHIQSADPIREIMISDIAGNIMYRSTTSLQQVNLQDFPSGLYLLKIQTKQGSVTKRIVKE